MLEELLKYDSLGSKDELLFLLFEALPLSKDQKISDLRDYCISNHFSIGRSFDGILKLLEFMAFIKISGERVSVNEDLFDTSSINHYVSYFEQCEFAEFLFSSLNRANVIADFIKPDALKRDVSKGLFYVKDSLIPVRFFGLRNLLISVGVLGRDANLKSGDLYVKSNCSEFFEKLVVGSLAEVNRFPKRRSSLSNLKSQLARQEKLGKDAEIFVICFEQSRLQGHPSFDKIKRISDDYVNAGFDIESYNDTASVFVDRFIEVKSFSDKVEFHWSQNEVEVAKDLEQEYFLYLVDRSKMLQSDYAPMIFRNPYQMIYENEFWVREPESWKFSAPSQDNSDK